MRSRRSELERRLALLAVLSRMLTGFILSHAQQCSDKDGLSSQSIILAPDRSSSGDWLDALAEVRGQSQSPAELASRAIILSWSFLVPTNRLLTAESTGHCLVLPKIISA